MSVSKARIDTLRALVAAAGSRIGPGTLNPVDIELQDVLASRKVSPERRQRLLQTFHGMRAIETALKEVLVSHGQPRPQTMGSALHALAALPAGHAAHLSGSGLNRFLASVKDERNRLMHNANSCPSTARAADTIFGEVAACFSLMVK